MSGKGKKMPMKRPGVGKGKCLGAKGKVGYKRFIATNDPTVIRAKAFPTSGLRRLGLRGGMRRISGSVYEKMRGDLEKLANKIVKDTVLHVELAGRKTVKVSDMLRALENNGIRIRGYALK